MAKKDKPQPGPDGVIRLSPGYPDGSVTSTGIPIRDGQAEGRVDTTKGPYIVRPISSNNDVEPRV